MSQASVLICATNGHLAYFFKVINSSAPPVASKGKGSRLDLGTVLPFNPSDLSFSTVALTGTLRSIMCRKVFAVHSAAP